MSTFRIVFLRLCGISSPKCRRARHASALFSRVRSASDGTIKRFSRKCRDPFQEKNERKGGLPFSLVLIKEWILRSGIGLCPG